MAFGGQTNTRTRLWTRGSQTVVAFVHAARKRRRTLVIAAISLTLVGALVTYGVFRYLQVVAADALVRGYGSLYHCLLGEPLAPGERASSRFRAIQLSALTQSDILRNNKEQAPWPDRCATHAHQLHEGVAASYIGETDAGKQLLASSLTLAEALGKKENYYADLSVQVDAVFGAAAEADIVNGGAGGVAAPPPAATALTVDSLPGLFTNKSTDLAAIGTPPVLSGTAQILVTDPALERSPFTCSITPGKAACKSVGKPAAEGGKLALKGSTGQGSAPLLFGDAAVFRADDGSQLLDRAALTGNVAADGVIDLLTAKGPRLSWVRLDQGKRRELPVLLGAGITVSQPANDVVFVGEHLLALVGRRDASLLTSARIDGQRLSPAAEIGPLDGFTRIASANIDACRSDGAVVVRVQSADASYLSFWLGSRWSAPIKAQAGPATLACKGQQATLSRHRAGAEGQLDGKIEVQTCTPKGCEATSASLGQLLTGELGLAPPSVIDLVAVDGASLVTWLAGQRGGLRLRVAAAKELGSAPDIIAFDDLVNGGKVQAVSTISDVRALSAGSYAVILLGTIHGLRALTVNAAGKVEPVAVSWK